MDWSVFFTTFITIFIAEMGDKTQFAAMAASAGSKSTFTIGLAVVLALSCAGIIGVLAGRVLSEFISPDRLRIVSGVAFILVGIWVLFGKE